MLRYNCIKLKFVSKFELRYRYQSICKETRTILFIDIDVV